MTEKYLGCSGCKHFNWDFKCQAFPNRIPLPVISGEIEHTKRLRWQDNDIIYEPIEVKVPVKI